MGTLNKAETETLLQVQATIEAVLKGGYDPTKGAGEHVLLRAELMKAKGGVKAIVIMRGHALNR